MTLHVSDLSNYQKPNIDSYPSDGYIFKATEGTSFVDKNCDIFVQQAIKAGKPFGVYHFMNGSHWKSQADHFIQSTKNYHKKGILALDYEMYGMQGASVAEKWLDYVKEQTGVAPLIYMNVSTMNGDNWASVAEKYGLWIAYPNGKGNYPNIAYWNTATLHQYTFDPHDQNEFFGNRETWDKLAGGKPSKQSTQKKPKQIKEDGKAGTEWATRLQEIYDCKIVDGVISRQIKTKSNKYVYSAEWGRGGSNVIKKIQKELKKQGVYSGKIDGNLGPKCVDGMQRIAGTTHDGFISPVSDMIRWTQIQMNKDKRPF